MLYFPVLSQPNTFVLAAKNMYNFTPNHPNRLCLHLPNPQQQCQPPPPPPPPPPASSCLPPLQNLTQTMLGQNGQFTSPANTGPLRPPDNRWQVQHYHCGPSRPNPNSIPLPQPQTLYQYGFIPNPPFQIQPTGQPTNPNNEYAASQSWSWIIPAQLECHQNSGYGNKMHVNLYIIPTIFLTLQTPQNMTSS